MAPAISDCKREGKQRGNDQGGVEGPDRERRGGGSPYPEIDDDPRRRSSSLISSSGGSGEELWCMGMIRWCRERVVMTGELGETRK